MVVVAVVADCQPVQRTNHAVEGVETLGLGVQAFWEEEEEAWKESSP